MNLQFSRWDKIRSYLVPKVIEKRQSPINPYLEVSYTRGKLMLNTSLANYSFGGLHTVFQIAFKNIKPETLSNGNMLLLGLGAGSVPSIIYEELKLQVNITAVEIDSVVIDIGKEYFNTARFEQLRIICADAYDYLQQTNETFNSIIIDIYNDVIVPGKFETRDFLQLVYTHLNPGGIMLFNKVAATQKLYWQYRSVYDMTQEIFGNVRYVRAMGFNKVIIAKK